MAEKMDPEDVTTVMNSCFRMVEGIVTGQGGTIDKYIGDCVMAVFGAPYAVENSARRAVLAALEIRARLQQFNREQRLQVPLDVHIGINSGLVIAGDVGGDVKRDFTVMGDTVNLAARLEDASERGQIFVGESTYSYTREHFEFRKLQPLTLKGKSEAVTSFEVLASKERTGGPRLGSATRQIGSDLVGREKEIGLLREGVVRLLGGEGGVMSIIAEAGLGKSRLVMELAGMQELERATLLEGRSESLQSGKGYQPFIDLFRHWAAIKDEDPEAQAFAKLEERVTALAGEDADEILPFVATLMGLRLTGAHAERVQGIEGEAMERLVLKATSDLLVGLAAERPLVLFFEDLHWADLSSIKLLELLLRLALEHRILFIHASRPGFDDTSDRIVSQARSRLGARAVEVRLEPLNAKQSAVLIQNLLHIDNLPHTTRAHIVEAAEGNPFFIEEVIRALIDQHAIEVRDGSLTVTEKIASVAIPGSIQEVIMVRVDQLDARTRQVLQIASVIGRSFHHRVLESLVEPAADLESVLTTLKERQLVIERPSRQTASVRRASFVAEREYLFKHVLIQETICNSLLNKTRKELHLRVARCIEQVFADRLIDFHAMLAFHYGRAESFEKAEEYLFKAGEEAVRAAASSEALKYFREASRVYLLLHGDAGDPKKKAALEKNIALALLNTGNLIDSIPHFDHALQHLGEPIREKKSQLYRQLAFDLAAIAWRLYVLRGKTAKRPATESEREILEMLYNRARAQSTTDPQRFFFDSMRSVARLNGVAPGTVEDAFAMYAGAAILFSFSGASFAIARRFLEVARSVIREDRITDLFTYRLMRFMCDYFEGRWDQPSEISDELVEQVIRTGQVWDADTFLGMDAGKSIDGGRFAEAERRVQQIRGLITDYGYNFAETNQLAMTAFIALEQRRLDDALRAIDEYLERPEELMNLLGLGTKAKIQVLGGSMEDARQTLDRAGELVERIGIAPPFHVGAYRLSSLLYDVVELERAVAAGDGARAKGLRKRARADAGPAIKVAASMARHRTEANRLMGSYQWIIGARGRAAKWWERSLREGERLGAWPEVGRTHLEVARRLASADGKLETIAGGNAASHLEHASEIFLRLGLASDLDAARDLGLADAPPLAEQRAAAGQRGSGT